MWLVFTVKAVVKKSFQLRETYSEHIYDNPYKAVQLHRGHFSPMAYICQE